MVTMTSTEAQNGFGRVLDTVARGGRVTVTRHDTPQAVVISAEEYQALTRGERDDLDSLTAEFDALLARMQTPEAGEALRGAFDATPDELGRAAVEAAREHAG
jgi:prevent-host-death family protein